MALVQCERRGCDVILDCKLLCVPESDKHDRTQIYFCYPCAAELEAVASAATDEDELVSIVHDFLKTRSRSCEHFDAKAELADWWLKDQDG